MATTLDALDVPVHISYGCFVVRDVWCDAYTEYPVVTEGTVLEASSYHLLIRSVSRVARLHLQVWDTEPAAGADSWDSSAEAELHCPTGTLLVEQITLAPAAELDLPTGAGVYRTRLHRQGQDAPDRALRDIHAAMPDADLDQLTAAADATSALARFRLDMWHAEPLPPDDDDDDFLEESDQ